VKTHGDTAAEGGGRRPALLVAPDSFKGTFSAARVAQAIGRGAAAAGVEAVLCPVADGGEGTLDALVSARGGELRRASASDPLGRPLHAPWALLDDGATAVLESAAASGLHHLGPRPTPAAALAASTAGTGELIVAARDAGARRVLLGVGGSATTDGGRGAIEAIARAGGLRGVQLDVICDVDVPFERAPAVFAPQKGADAATVALLEARLDALAATLPRDPRGVPMTGCAGGLSGGLWAAFGARLHPGAGFVLDAIGFDAQLARATAVATGEGRLDEQTLAGKLIAVVAARCRAARVPLHAVVGQCALPGERVRELSLASVSVAPTEAALEAAGRALGERLTGVASAGDVLVRTFV